MTDQQPERSRQQEEAPPREGAEQEQQPAPPPWPTLGADWKDRPAPPPPQSPSWESAPWGRAADQEQGWEPPPAYQQWSQPPATYGPYGPPGAQRFPGARISDAEARNWALAAHLSPLLAAMVGLPFLGPLVIWLAKRSDHPYVAEQAREALNFNLSMFIYSLGITVASFIGLVIFIGVLGFAFLGLVLLPLWLVLVIVGAVKAANGEDYRYPLTMRLVN